MGASNRDRAQVMQPKPCWYYRDRSSLHPRHPPVPAILLEWRRTQAPNGPRYEGLVAYARGGGELPWQLEVAWVKATELGPAH